MRISVARRCPFQLEWALFILILLAGFAIRFYALGQLPHGIYHDEAYYGLDALKVLQGERPIFFTANNGREPLYIYLLSASIAVFGRTPFALRFIAAVAGMLVLPVTYLLGREMFGKRAGLLAMAIGAFTFWAVALSRVGFRAGLLPLVTGLAILFGWRAITRRSLAMAIASGTAYGLAFYTYAAARVTPLAIVLIALAALLLRGKSALKPHARSMLAFGLSTAMVVLPLAMFALTNPQLVFAREGQVSIFAGTAGAVATLAKHGALALGMFGWRGDSIARHNLPGRPVFDVWTFALFLLGVVVCLRAARRSMAHLTLLIWILAGLLPTVLAQDTPHFLRATAILPLLWLVPAVGFETAIARVRPRWAMGAAIVLVLATGVTTTRDYFVTYANDPTTRFFFESAATDLANALNSRSSYETRINNRLWDNFASLHFLIPNPSGTPNPTHVQLAVWPYEPDDVRAAIAQLPPASRISAQRGQFARGDLETNPYELYWLYLAEPATHRNLPPVANFGGQIVLQAAEVWHNGGESRVRLLWSAGDQPIEQDYHLYVHVFQNELLISQWDGEPLQGLYHFTWLRPGDVLDDVIAVQSGERILVGLYAPDGTLFGDSVELK